MFTFHCSWKGKPIPMCRNWYCSNLLFNLQTEWKSSTHSQHNAHWISRFHVLPQMHNLQNTILHTSATLMCCDLWIWYAYNGKTSMNISWHCHLPNSTIQCLSIYNSLIKYELRYISITAFNKLNFVLMFCMWKKIYCTHLYSQE